MAELFLLSKRSMARIAPDFPLSRGVPRVVSGIVYMIRNGEHWKDALGYGPNKMLYNPFIR